MDQFDLIELQFINRLKIESAQQTYYKETMKAHKTIMKKYKKETKEQNKSIREHVLKSQEILNFMVNKKRDLLSDSIFEITKDVTETMKQIKIIFDLPPNKLILKLSVQRRKLIENHYYKTRNIPTEHNCLICIEPINKFSLIYCNKCVAKYHDLCIEKWFENSDKCPMCKCLIYANMIYI